MKKLLLLLTTVALLGACAQMDQTAATNKASAERMTAEVWNAGNMEVLGELMADDFVRHNPASWTTPKIEGADAFREYMAQIKTMYPDFKVEVHSRMAEGDMVAASWTVTGTHSELNKSISVMGMTMTRFADGKAAEEWVTWDTAGYHEQLEGGEEETTMK